jgi:AcrR family transcriptional regulator
MADPDTEGASRTAAAKRPGGRSARVKRAVFDATLDLLARLGYQGMTFDAVAEAARVNKTTIYRNWPTKTALLLAAAEDRSEALIRTESTGDPEANLIAFLASVHESISSPLGQALVIATLSGANDPEASAAREEFWRVRFAAAHNVVRAATSGRRAGEPDIDAVIERLIGPLFLRVFITGAPVDDAFIRSTVRAALCDEG